MIPLRATRIITEQCEAWIRLQEVPNLAEALIDRLRHIFKPAGAQTTPARGIKARTLAAHRAKHVDDALEVFARPLAWSLDTKPEPVLFFPGYNACFACLPKRLAEESIDLGHPPAELRMAVQRRCPRFGEALKNNLTYFFFPDGGRPGAIEERLRQLGLPLAEYFGVTDFGDLVFKNEAQYRRYCREEHTESKTNLSFVRLAKWLQLM